MRGFLWFLGGLLALSLVGCDAQSEEERREAEFDRSALLVSYRDALIVPAYLRLQTSAVALEAASDAFTTRPTAEGLAQLRGTLRAARLDWQGASLFEFGPAEAVLLRSSLNTFPADTARIERNIASGSFTPGSVGDRAAGGFPALDYLLHADSDEQIVSDFFSIATGPQRRAYLERVVASIRESADAVAAEWMGAYGAAFVDPSRAGTDVGSSLGMLLNAWVMHYERFARDGQIGIPAGVRSAGVARPMLVEAPYGGYSAELAAANARASLRLFEGTGADGADGPGLDDYLTALGATPLGERISAEFAEVIAALEALDDPLDEQIKRDPTPALDAFREMQDVVVLLKADLASVLGVTVTFQDNDGD
jgi:predicted lipoprotein